MTTISTQAQEFDQQKAEDLVHNARKGKGKVARMMKKVIGTVIATAIAVGVLASPAQANHNSSPKIALSENGGTNRFKVSVSLPENLVDTKECSWEDNQTLLRWQVRTSKGRLITEHSRCINDWSYTGSNPLRWTWNQKGLDVGTYHIVAKVSYKEEGKGVTTLVSNTLDRTKKRRTKYNHGIIRKSGLNTSSRTCIKQPYGNCSFHNHSAFTKGELFVIGTFAKAITVYKLTIPKGTIFSFANVYVDRFNGRRPQVTKSRNGRTTTITVTRNGFDGQTSGSNYWVQVKWRAANPYYEYYWVRG